jgi:hypothetical protein
MSAPGYTAWETLFPKDETLHTEIEKNPFRLVVVARDGIELRVPVEKAKDRRLILGYDRLDALWESRDSVKGRKNALTAAVNEVWKKRGLKTDYRNESQYWALVCERERRLVAGDVGSEAEAEAESFSAQERAAGFQSDPKVRDVVEKYAMEKAKEELGSRGFASFHNTSDGNCYDYTCERDGILYYVEVKGTQGSGTSVILTKNEVEHWKQYKQTSIAVIVHGVKVDREKEDASGGSVQVCFPWTFEPAALEALQYKWTLSGCPEGPAT